MNSTYTFEETEIDGIECQLEIDNDMSHCYLNKRQFSGTLEFLKAFGVLEDAQGHQLAIKSRTQREIAQWADSLGY